MGERAVLNLQDVWDVQGAFNAKLRSAPVTVADRESLTVEFIVHLIKECTELLDCVQWKSHRASTSRPLNLEHIHDELTDIFKMWMTVAQLWMTPEQAFRCFYEKSLLVEQRWYQEFVADRNAQVLVMDLDNVVVNFTEGFIRYLYTEHGIQPQEISGAGVRPIRRADVRNGTIPSSQWRAWKTQFYLSRAFMDMPPIAGSVEFVTWAVEQGLSVCFMTSRPAHHYPHLARLTAAWLNRHGFRYDFIWFDDRKPRMLIDNKVENIVLAVDDDPLYIQQYSDAGIPAAWLTHGTPQPGAVASFDEVKEMVSHGIRR